MLNGVKRRKMASVAQRFDKRRVKPKMLVVMPTWDDREDAENFILDV
jgi:hypothetical protein